MFDFRERGKEWEREKENERKTSIHVCALTDTEPTTLACLDDALANWATLPGPSLGI